MKPETLERILLLSRIAILEMMVVRLDVLVRAERLQCSTNEALQQTLKAYEEAARAMEQVVYHNPELAQIPAEERGVIADEYRELMEQIKTRAADLFGLSK